MSSFVLRYVTEDFATEMPLTSMLPTVASPLSTTTSISSVASPSNNPTNSTTPMTATSLNTAKPSNRNRGVIFPSVKNKPSLTNSTFTNDVLINYKDVKVFLFILTVYKFFQTCTTFYRTYLNVKFTKKI